MPKDRLTELAVLDMQDCELDLGVVWPIDKWGILNAFYIKAECFLSNSLMPFSRYLLVSSCGCSS